MKRLFRFIVISLAVLAVLALCVWLHFPKSLVMMAQGIGQQTRPVDFDIEFTGLSAGVSGLSVQLMYVPQSPVLGITEHYWSIIAPLRVDTISRTLQIPANHGNVHWTAPLGLAGLSNYRLQSVQV